MTVFKVSLSFGCRVSEIYDTTSLKLLYASRASRATRLPTELPCIDCNMLMEQGLVEAQGVGLV